MMSIRTYSISSTEDEVPPKNIIIVRRKVKNDNVNAYESLCRRSREHCEFCDQKFSNKYTSIKHNATHIIIPLVKQQVHQCAHCLFYFTSINKLTQHTAIKHPVEPKHTKESKVSPVKIEPTYDFDNDVDSEKFNMESVEKKFNKESVEKKFNKESVEKKFNKESVEKKASTYVDCDIKTDKESFDSYKDYHSKALEIVNSLKLDSFFNNGIINANNSNGMKFSSKIKFEDDFDLELEKEANVFNGLVNCKDKEDECFKNSVHYDDLIAPGLYNCKRCKKKFPNRYKLIVHESVHASINRKGPYYALCQLCDKYIAGNHIKLAHHVETRHNTSYIDYKQNRQSSLLLSRCEKCHLKFVNSVKHDKNFHCDRYSPVDFNEITEKSYLKTTEEQPGDGKNRRTEKTKEICGDCIFFFKKWTRSHYVLSGVKEEFGMRFPCDMCKKQCFHLKIVTIKGLRHKVDEKVRTVGPQVVRKRGIKKTNKDRLKNIQHRLKVINYLNKF